MLPFVSREKLDAVNKTLSDLQAQYDALVKEKAEMDKQFAKLLKSSEALEAHLQELQSSDLAKQVTMLNERIAKTEKEFAEKTSTLQSTITSLEKERDQLKASLKQKDETIADQEQTIDRLNNGEVPQPSTHAPSPSDEGQVSDIETFVTQNAENQQAIFERFEKEGF